MSEAANPLDLRAILARIDRDLAEQAKLRAESDKLQAEQRKLIAEERKINRDRWLAPALAVASVLGGLLGAGAFIARIITGH